MLVGLESDPGRKWRGAQKQSFNTDRLVPESHPRAHGAVRAWVDRQRMLVESEFSVGER